MPTRSTPQPVKLLVAAISTAVAVGVCWIFMPNASKRDTVHEVDARAALTEAFENREPVVETEPEARIALPRWPLNESEAATFFPRSVGDVYDPFTFTRRKSNVSVNRPFPEHPAGKWVIKTNSLGMREDSEPAAEKPDLRVVIAGDSHVDGVCPNAESYPNQLESLLQAQYPDKSIEVLNVGNGGWSFYNYLGALERFESLDPDVFVVTVYGGNDFGSLPIHHYFRGEELSLTAPAFGKKLRELASVQTGRAQFWNQAAYFESNPSEVEAAKEMAVEVTAEMQAVAADQGVELIAVYLPPIWETQRELYDEELEPGLRILGLSDAGLSASGEIADAWVEWLDSEDVPHLDLRDAFRASAEPLYWRTDQHVNTTANRLMAEALAPFVIEAWTRD